MATKGKGKDGGKNAPEMKNEEQILAEETRKAEGKAPRLGFTKELLAGYTKTKAVVDGKRKKLIDCGDDIANTFRGMNLDEVYEKSSRITGIPEEELRERYMGLNPGMQRMNLGNKVRAFLQRQEEGRDTRTGKAIKKAA